MKVDGTLALEADTNRGGLAFKRGQRNALKSLEMKVTFLLRKTHSKPV